MEELKRELIKKHLEFDDLNGFFKASVDYYCNTGKISGSFFMALKAMMDEYGQMQVKNLHMPDVSICTCGTEEYAEKEPREDCMTYCSKCGFKY